MNTGVEILLKRMETHPEEFVADYEHGGTKWGGIINRYNEYLTKEESEAINKAYKETVINVMRGRFTEAVMKELAGAGDETSDEGKSYLVPKTNTYPTGLPQHILDAQKYQTELMRQHLDEHRKALENIDDKDKSKMLEMLKSYVAYNKKKANIK